MASLMAKKMEAAKKRGGSPTPWVDRAGERESGRGAPSLHSRRDWYAREPQPTLTDHS